MTEPVDEPLDLEFEVEEDESTSSSEEEGDSDNDHGEVGEMGMQEDEVSVADEDEAQLLQTLAYQDEPEPRDPGRAGGDEDVGGGQAAVAELDISRMDSTENWCICGHCQVLPSFELGDCICCREIEEVSAEADRNDVTCITTAADYDAAILNAATLFIAWQHFTERWRQQARSFGNRNNEKYRYTAYRQFVRWCWGWLGRDIRVQLPACVQASIKRTYPDGGNVYKGTRLRRLDRN